MGKTVGPLFITNILNAFCFICLVLYWGLEMFYGNAFVLASPDWGLIILYIAGSSVLAATIISFRELFYG